jgi:hypothetical protein
MNKYRNWNDRPSFTVERRAIPPGRREARKAARPSKSPEKPHVEPLSGMAADMARQHRSSSYGFIPSFWKPGQ